MSALTIEQALMAAFELHRAGSLADAELIYRQVLAHQPRRPDALRLLAVLLHQTGRHQAAVETIDQAIGAAPQSADLFVARGQFLVTLGKADLAIEAFQRALQLSPRSATVMSDLATAQHAAGNLDQAVTVLREALVAEPDHAGARANLGCMLKLQGIAFASEARCDAAVKCFGQSLQFCPHDPETLHLLGGVLHQLGQSARAVEYLRKAVNLVPGSAEACTNLGIALCAIGATEESLAYFDKAIENNPIYATAYNNLGVALSDLGRLTEAIDAFDQAMVHQPKSVADLQELGLHFQAQGQRERGTSALTAAKAIESDRAAVRNNLGHVYAELLELDQAMQWYQEAIQISPDTDAAHWNVALLQLLRGEYEHGWMGYESRWRQSRFKPWLRSFSEPMLPRFTDLNAEMLNGKRVLLHAEQGFGDTLQFCRYAPLVAEAGACVTLEVPPELTRLLSALRGVSQVLPSGSEVPNFDYHCPLMSLPMLFGTTLENVPARVPYLTADPEDVQRWMLRMAERPNGLRVGLVWAGSSKHERDRQRSLKFADFLPVAKIEGVDFFSLQMGDASSQAVSPPDGVRLTDFTGELRDFADTAALLSVLDLVITVDTAVAHLAGALGKPVWILLTYYPDWRWLLDREDSPWYPNARLFRQQMPNDWSVPLHYVAQQLQSLVAR